MGVVAEHDLGQFELALAFDIDLLRAVDHDVGHGFVGHQRFERAEAQHVGDQRFDQLALFDEIELDLGFGQQLLDPAGQLRLESRARHFRRGGDVHVLEDERLDLRLGRLDRGAVRAAAGRRRRLLDLGGRRLQQRLHDVGDEVAPCQGIWIDPVADEIGLYGRVDEFGQFAAA